MDTLNAPLGRTGSTKSLARLPARGRRFAHWFEDGPALTVRAVDGEHPRGRELSFAWLAGTITTGVTSVMLMGAALFVSFQGQEGFSTPSEALLVQRAPAIVAPVTSEKGDRARPIARTRSDVEIVQASIQSTIDGRTMIRSQQFTRLDATLATSATVLAEDIPTFDPSALIEEENSEQVAAEPASLIYSANVEGEVAISTRPMPASFIPPRTISDTQASDFAIVSLQDVFVEEGSDLALAYVGESRANASTDLPLGVAENVTTLAKTPAPTDGSGRSERIVTLQEPGSLNELLPRNGFSDQATAMISGTVKNLVPSLTLPRGAKLRILMGPSRSSPVPIPYRLSIYLHDPKTNEIKHAVTAALTDRGAYVVGLAPGDIEFPDEDTEAVDVTALPSLYRSIWETARKHEIDDSVTSQIVALFAYELDLNQKVVAGDEIKLLTTVPDGEPPDLLYASLTTGQTTRELFRFQNEDGGVDFYSPDGETGKRFLTRRPLQGGGRLASRYGYRVHPIFKDRRLHSGVDLASPLGTPVYAGGDGVVRRAQWVSGYGRYVELDHVNGYQTAYAHMSRIADGLKPGDRVKQGQLVGYVGSTGNSTGNHLHYEIRINGRTVDPLSVKLPRDKELPSRARETFVQATTQIRELMESNAAEHAEG